MTRFLVPNDATFTWPPSQSPISRTKTGHSGAFSAPKRTDGTCLISILHHLIVMTPLLTIRANPCQHLGSKGPRNATCRSYLGHARLPDGKRPRSARRRPGCRWNADRSDRHDARRPRRRHMRLRRPSRPHRQRLPHGPHRQHDGRENGRHDHAWRKYRPGIPNGHDRGSGNGSPRIRRVGFPKRSQKRNRSRLQRPMPRVRTSLSEVANR